MWRQPEGRLLRTGASFCQPKNTSLAGAWPALDIFPLPEIYLNGTLRTFRFRS